MSEMSKREGNKKKGNDSRISTIYIGDIIYKNATVHSKCAIKDKQSVYVQDRGKILGICHKTQNKKVEPMKIFSPKLERK